MRNFIYFYEVNLKEFLEKNPIITMTGLAKGMWPSNKSARSKLNNKVHENAGQRILPEDTKEAIKVLDKLVENIEEFKKQNPQP